MTLKHRKPLSFGGHRVLNGAVVSGPTTVTNGRRKTNDGRCGRRSSGSGGSSDVDDRGTADVCVRQLSLVIVFAVYVGGLLAVVCVSSSLTRYVTSLHETNMFFSSIKEVEREISFRTESGLYYSYYKQLLAAPSLLQGVYDLTRDNITEHPSTINVLARMNIYQEVVLAAIYRSLPFLQQRMEAVYFYIDVVFALHGLLIGSLFVISWLLSGTWLAGLLTSMFYVFNRIDVTRVEQWIPLRENFSLPFLWVQIAVLTVYFRRSLSPLVERSCRLALMVFTFLFAVTWQFNQFALLLQAMALFGVQVLHLVERKKCLTGFSNLPLVFAACWSYYHLTYYRMIFFVYASHVFAMFAVFLLQFFNPMIISGLHLSFLAACVVILFVQDRVACHSASVSRNLLLLFSRIFGVFLLAFIFNFIVKFVIKQEADEHIYRFVLTKFGLVEPSRDFDVRLYLCNGAFQFLDVETFLRLSSRLVFPVYVVAHPVLLAILAVTVLTRWRCIGEENESSNSSYFATHPELAYHVVQAVFFGAVGLMALRMKFFWTPYVCVIASCSMADKTMWTWILERFRCRSETMVNVTRHVVIASTMAALLYVSLPSVYSELENLREFYDPDTVQLMEWIKSSTESTASFTGSMQLLAGVKLCTGRPITNHPHYEDKSLRLRTRELYRIYGRYTAENVSSIMYKYSVDYVIVEDSHCFVPSRNGCSLRDIVDVDGGMIPDSGLAEYGLVRSKVPRFCDEIRYNKRQYSMYFRLVFSNPTFRVYRVQKGLKESDLGAS